MTIYEKAKSLVTAREAAEHYGLASTRYNGTYARPPDIHLHGISSGLFVIENKAVFCSA